MLLHPFGLLLMRWSSEMRRNIRLTRTMSRNASGDTRQGNMWKRAKKKNEYACVQCVKSSRDVPLVMCTVVCHDVHRTSRRVRHEFVSSLLGCLLFVLGPLEGEILQ